MCVLFVIQVEEQTGTTMMYNITEAVKEWMQERNVKAMSMHEQVRRHLIFISALHTIQP
jgi:hypothetical protein